MKRLVFPALTIVICLGTTSWLVAVQPGGGCAGCDAAAGGYSGGGYDDGGYGGGYGGGGYGGGGYGGAGMRETATTVGPLPVATMACLPAATVGAGNSRWNCPRSPAEGSCAGWGPA